MIFEKNQKLTMEEISLIKESKEYRQKLYEFFSDFSQNLAWFSENIIKNNLISENRGVFTEITKKIDFKLVSSLKTSCEYWKLKKKKEIQYDDRRTIFGTNLVKNKIIHKDKINFLELLNRSCPHEFNMLKDKNYSGSINIDLTSSVIFQNEEGDFYLQILLSHSEHSHIINCKIPFQKNI